MPDDVPKVELNFNREMDNVVGEGADQFFKNNLVRLLKSSATVNSIAETEALRDIRGEIARSEGPIEITNSDLDLLETHINRALGNEGTKVPNQIVEEFADLLKEGREQLPDRGEE